MKSIKYSPDKCEHCQQTTTYASMLNRGIMDIVQSIANAIGRKGINAIHPMKEMLAKPGEASSRELVRMGKLTPRQIGNITHACRHGLITRLSETGTFCLTKKGAAFLRGEPVPLVAIISKQTHHNIDYLNHADGSPRTITVRDLRKRGEEGAYWDGINYDIHEGRVIPSTTRKDLV